MKIAVCRHGNESGIIIESDADFENELFWTKVQQKPCEECTKEALATFVVEVAQELTKR
jgi:hypothetical protein